MTKSDKIATVDHPRHFRTDVYATISIPDDGD
jgi:hypothetical protein